MAPLAGPSKASALAKWRQKYGWLRSLLPTPLPELLYNRIKQFRQHCNSEEIHNKESDFGHLLCIGKLVYNVNKDRIEGGQNTAFVSVPRTIMLPLNCTKEGNRSPDDTLACLEISNTNLVQRPNNSLLSKQGVILPDDQSTRIDH